MESFQLGTKLSVLASPEGRKVRVDFVYESSRIDGEITEDPLPSIMEIQIHATHLVLPGEPVVVSTMEEGGESTVVTLVVED